jgi:hypothetical protein
MIPTVAAGASSLADLAERFIAPAKEMGAAI